MTDGKCKAVSLILRIIALALSVAAAAVMGTASQLVIVDVDGDRGSSRYTVSYTQYNALKFFVAAGAIAAVCSAAALYLFAVRAAVAFFSLSVVPLLDAAAQGLLFSAAGAAFTARGDWGGGGVCDAAAAFCGKVSVAAGVGAIAAVAVAVAALAGDARRRRSGCSGGSCGDC
ncbi:unnamed protein product [Urochloa humidicola]